MKSVRLRINDYEHRNNMIAALTANGYNAWLENIPHPRLSYRTIDLVCFEIKENNDFSEDIYHPIIPKTPSEEQYFVFDEYFGYKAFKDELDAKTEYNERLHNFTVNYPDYSEEMQSLVWGIEKSSGEWHRSEDMSGEIECTFKPFPESIGADDNAEQD